MQEVQLAEQKNGGPGDEITIDEFNFDEPWTKDSYPMQIRALLPKVCFIKHFAHFSNFFLIFYSVSC